MGEPIVTANLTTQRNAIKMLYDRVSVIVEYLGAVSEGTVVKDQETLRQISALITSLPAVNSRDFQEEFMTVRCSVQSFKLDTDCSLHRLGI